MQQAGYARQKDNRHPTAPFPFLPLSIIVEVYLL